MKKYIIFMLCLLFLSPTVAQEKVDRKGKKALQFDFDGLKLSNPISNISSIGGKYWWRNNLAIRAGFQFENSFYETDYDNYDQSDSDGSINKIKLFLLVENHFRPFKKISPYIGGKIGFSFNQSKENQKSSGEKTKLTDFDYSIGVLFGIEYWLNKNISLSGHQEIYYEYGLLKRKSDYEPYEYNRNTIKSTTSSLILSFYF